MASPWRWPRRRLSAVAEFLTVESLSGIALLAATIGALTWATVSWGSYDDVWSTHLTVGIGSFAIDESLQHWINDGLMAIFFFVVGLEVKRELVRGQLRDPRTASLPVMAAVGGMVVPAALFLLLNRSGPGADGWATPMATDIAFAVAVVTLLGSRVPSGAKLFLLTLAIADDIGAVLVIAIFYSEGIELPWLLGAVGVVVGMLVMRRVGFASPAAYVAPALVLWLCMFESGVHATLAGVVLGLLTPAGEVRGEYVIERLEHRLHPWSSFFVVPLFALANAGIPLGLDEMRHAASSSIAWGIVLGLVVGKPLGIVIATAIGLRTRLGQLPAGTRMTHVVGLGQLAGIGFTVSLFVASLSFTGVRLNDAKTAILTASTISAAWGAAILVAMRAGIASPPRRHRSRRSSAFGAPSPDHNPSVPGPQPGWAHHRRAGPTAVRMREQVIEMMPTIDPAEGLWSEIPGAPHPAAPYQVVTETDTKYRDADGDGLLDTVEVTESLVAIGTDFRRVLAMRRVVLGAVGDDGEPHEVSVHAA